MKLRELVESILCEPPVAFHGILAKICGNANAGLMLSQAMYWTKSRAAQDRDGWFYKTAREWYDEICLSRHEQDTAKRILKQRGFLEMQTRRAGREMTPTLHFRVNLEAISKAIAEFAEKRQTGLPQAVPKSGNPEAENRQTEVPESDNSSNKQVLRTSTTTNQESGNSASELPQSLFPGNKPKPEKQEEIDPREPGILKAIRSQWPKNCKCDITPADIGAIRRMLRVRHSWTEEQLALCIVARFLSGEHIDPGESVKAWIGAIADYQTGPKDKFGHPVYAGAELDAWRENQARVILYGKQPAQQKLQGPTREQIARNFIAKVGGHANELGRQLFISLRAHLKQRVSAHSFETWFSPARFLCLTAGAAGALYVLMPSDEFLHVGEKWKKEIDSWLPEAIKSVEFVSQSRIGWTGE